MFFDFFAKIACTLYIIRAREVLVEKRHVAAQLLHRYLCVNLGGGDIGVSQYPADALNRYPGVEGHDGERVAGAVVVKPEINGRQMEAIKNLKR